MKRFRNENKVTYVYCNKKVSDKFKGIKDPYALQALCTELDNKNTELTLKNNVYELMLDILLSILDKED